MIIRYFLKKLRVSNPTKEMRGDMEHQLYECEVCNQKALMHVDDEGSLGGLGMSWDHYICKVCLSEKDVTKKWYTGTTTWVKRNEFVARTDEEARELYRSFRQ